MPISVRNVINRLISRGRSSTVNLGGELSFSREVTLRVKHSFSKQHFAAAEYFSEEANRIEHSSQIPSEVDKSKHRAYVTGAVLSSVAALEASINELYLEAKDRNKNTLSGLADPDLAALASQWTSSVESLKVLKKYQEALKTLGRNEFNKGIHPYQDADSLIYLRNALVHYRPEWDDEAKVHAKIQARLKKKFALNAFSDSGSLWFPHQCMGAGCAIWSVETTKAFMSEFCKRLGIANRF